LDILLDKDSILIHNPPVVAKLAHSEAVKIMLAAKFKPLEEYPGSSTPWKCRCLRCKSIVKVRRTHILSGRSGCQSCAKVSRSVSQRLNPAITVAAMQRAKLEPLEEYLNSDKPWKCKCLVCGKVVRPTYSHIKQGRGGCNYCAKKNAGITQRIPEADAIQLMRKSGFEPITQYVKNDKPWKCKCLICGRVSHPTLAHIKGRHSKCQYCAGTSLASDQVKARFKHFNLRPLEKYQKGHPTKSQCIKCGSVFFFKLANVSVKNGRGACLSCGRERAGISRRIPKETALIRFKEMSLEPLEPYVNGKTPWKSKCLKCGAVVSPKPGYVFSGQGGCSNCAEYGIKMFAPSYIYILEHKDFGAYKVGIGNVPKNDKNDRIKKLLRDGWIVLKKFNCQTGQVALNTETSVLNILRNEMNIPQYLTKEQLKYRGETETLNCDLISHLNLVELVKHELKKFA
jgi:recombinational DNA repair protein (RecF pathway)